MRKRLGEGGDSGSRCSLGLSRDRGDPLIEKRKRETPYLYDLQKKKRGVGKKEASVILGLSSEGGGPNSKLNGIGKGAMGNRIHPQKKIKR